MVSLRFSEVDWEPLSYVADYPEYKGVIADYLQILTETTGIEMEFIQSRTWEEVLEKFRNKEIDLIPALSLKDMIGTEVILTDPYISFPLVIASRPDIDFISNTHELEGKRVAVGKGYTSYNFLKNNYPDIELFTTDSVIEGLRLLEKGSIDAFVGHMAVVMDAIKNSRLNLHIAGKTEYVFEHRIGLPPEHAQTVAIFNRVLAGITPEEHNRIYNSWIKMNTDSADYSLVWKILTASFIIIILIFVWNRKISAEKMHIQSLLRDLETLKNQLELKNDELEKFAITDQLTGLNNRFKLDNALENELSRYARFQHPFGIILMDIDHFKDVNDSYGHATGDKILVCIASLLQFNIRKTDILGRWGGEEFLIICPEIDIEGMEKLAEKLRQVIESYDFPEAHSVTMSFGVSSYRKGDELTHLFKRSDDALYQAKNNGRNRVVLG